MTLLKADAISLPLADESVDLVVTSPPYLVARALGRYPVHVDLSADYLRLARWRIYESGHASKTTERTNRERQQVLL